MNRSLMLFVFLAGIYGCSSAENNEKDGSANNKKKSTDIFGGYVDEITYVYHYNSDDLDGSGEKVSLETDPALSILVQADDCNEDMISDLGNYFNHRVYLSNKEEVISMLGNFSFSDIREGKRNNVSCETYYRDLFILYSKQKYVGCIKVDFKCGNYTFITQDKELLKLTDGMFLNFDPAALKSVLVKNRDRKDF